MFRGTLLIGVLMSMSSPVDAAVLCVPKKGDGTVSIRQRC